jgi:hypothetical protein
MEVCRSLKQAELVLLDWSVVAWAVL